MKSALLLPILCIPEGNVGEFARIHLAEKECQNFTLCIQQRAALKTAPLRQVMVLLWEQCLEGVGPHLVITQPEAQASLQPAKRHVVEPFHGPPPSCHPDSCQESRPRSPFSILGTESHCGPSAAHNPLKELCSEFAFKPKQDGFSSLLHAILNIHLLQ